MKLPEIDLLEAKIAQALMRLLDQIFRTADGQPDIGTVAGQAALGGDDRLAAIGMQRFLDQPFGDIGAVGIGRIDEVDAEFRQALQRADGFGMIGRLAPDALAGDAHGAETETIDLDIAADLEGA
jgi:hypothetical protein